MVIEIHSFNEHKCTKSEISALRSFALFINSTIDKIIWDIGVHFCEEAFWFIAKSGKVWIIKSGSISGEGVISIQEIPIPVRLPEPKKTYNIIKI